MDYAASFLNNLPISRRGTGFKGLLNKLKYLPPSQIDVVVSAYEFGSLAHDGQRRYSGEPYITHPIAVAGILADLHLDHQSISAAIMHDVIEDTPTAKEQITAQFGQEIASIVDGVSKLDQLSFDSRAEAQAESFRKMMLAMVEDIRVILLKLADRLHNMQTLGALPADKQRRIARETLEIYAPIANRIGVYNIKTELETLGFQYAYPYRYRVLDRAVKKTQGNQRQIVRRISDRLGTALKDAGITAEVKGRQKNLYSIYRKMLEKQRPLSEITDVFGFRIIVESTSDCYQALGIAHGLYKPVPGRFKDFIAIPRVNGYESLHTTLRGPNGIPVEVQIRTQEMNQVAESGIAAHWQYKASDKQIIPPQIRAREWLKSISEMQTAANSEEFMEHVKVDLFPDNVYVFTPKGRIMRLPRGATCVDFAYAVHTDVGNRCVAAKIDRRLVPLRTPLKNGHHRRDHHGQKRQPGSSLGQFRRHGQGALQHPPVPEESASWRSPSNSAGRLLNQALRDARHFAAQDRQAEDAGSARRTRPEEHERTLRTHRPRRTPCAAGRQGAAAGRARASQPGTILPTARRLRSPAPRIWWSATRAAAIRFRAMRSWATSAQAAGSSMHRTVCGNLSEFRKQPDKWIAVNWEKNIDQRIFGRDRHRSGQQTRVRWPRLPPASRIPARTSNRFQLTSVRKKITRRCRSQILVRDRKHLADVIRRIRSHENRQENFTHLRLKYNHTEPGLDKTAIHTDAAPAAIGTLFSGHPYR